MLKVALRAGFFSRATSGCTQIQHFAYRNWNRLYLATCDGGTLTIRSRNCPLSLCLISQMSLFDRVISVTDFLIRAIPTNCYGFRHLSGLPASVRRTRST